MLAFTTQGTIYDKQRLGLFISQKEARGECQLSLRTYNESGTAICCSNSREHTKQSGILCVEPRVMFSGDSLVVGPFLSLEDIDRHELKKFRNINLKQ